MVIELRTITHTLPLFRRKGKGREKSHIYITTTRLDEKIGMKESDLFTTPLGFSFLRDEAWHSGNTRRYCCCWVISD